MNVKGPEKKLVLKETGKTGEAEELTEAFNAIKDDLVKNGEVLGSKAVNVVDFAGKVLIRTKSIVVNNNQYSVKAGTKWEEIDAFYKKKLKFSAADFK